MHNKTLQRDPIVTVLDRCPTTKVNMILRSANASSLSGLSHFYDHSYKAYGLQSARIKTPSNGVLTTRISRFNYKSYFQVVPAAEPLRVAATENPGSLPVMRPGNQICCLRHRQLLHTYAGYPDIKTIINAYDKRSSRILDYTL